jgi:hypothetical protein
MSGNCFHVWKKGGGKPVIITDLESNVVKYEPRKKVDTTNKM